MGDFKTVAVGNDPEFGGFKKTHFTIPSIQVTPNFKLSKKFRFETAHRLAKGYVGKCSHLHGHSWNGEITVICTELDDQGMAIDYKDIGVFCKQIEDILDHKTILHEGDDKLIEALVGIGSDVVILKENPTSEVIAKYIYEKFEAHVASKGLNCRVYSVSIEETCTSRCVYGKDI